MTDSPRNIILLSADALRADHLSCYGYNRETSPRLDAFAEDCIRFENAYSASSHTREAVPALLTGEYPDVAVDSRYNLASETIASTLSGEGYATAGFHSNPFVSRAYGFDQGFDHFDDDLRLGQNKLIALAQRAFDKLRNRHYARAPEINERSLDWVESLDDDQPFFLWNHYMDTHGPYEPPNEYATLWAERGLSGRDAQSLYQRAIDDPKSITEDERQLLVDLYDAEIRYNDEYLGEFFEALRERGLLEESLVFVTADHGDAFGEHGYYEHPRYLHEEITKVPLLVRAPDGNSGVVATSASTLDIVSTIRSFCGANDVSLLNPFEDDRRVFSQARGEDDNSHLRRYAVRSAEGACFCEWNKTTGEVKFTETTVRSLRPVLDAHVDERVQQAQKGDTETNTDVDEEIERRLSALGYKE
ncbi:sulfatase [Haloarcula marismortui]|nr:sulfatase [Haloarcula sinaiiensis]